MVGGLESLDEGVLYELLMRSSLSASRHLGLITGWWRQAVVEVDAIDCWASVARGLITGFGSAAGLQLLLLLASEIILFDRLGNSGAIIDDEQELLSSEIVSAKSPTLAEETVDRLAWDWDRWPCDWPDCRWTLANTEYSWADDVEWWAWCWWWVDAVGEWSPSLDSW